MPNRCSHANFEATRTCVVCRQKLKQKSLTKLILTASGYVFDLKRIYPERGLYVCRSCESRIGVWLKKWRKRKRKKSGRK